MDHSKTPKTEKPDQMGWSLLLDDRFSGHARSYTCSFCRKGFSNAQALGGHMNIHRKDRAKLREISSDESMLSLDVAKSASKPLDPSQILDDKDLIILESSEEKISTLSTPRIPSNLPAEDESSSSTPPRGRDAIEELRQLNLFVEAPSTSDEIKRSNCAAPENEDKSMRSAPGPLHRELDLELRLGPEPDHETSRSTIEFF